MPRTKGAVHVLSGRIGMAERLGRHDEARELRGDLTIARIDAAIQRELADAPPLTDRQKADLQRVLSAVNA